MMSKYTVFSAKENVTAFAADVKGYTNQLWLAGLGGYSKAGKEGVEYFKKLVDEGEATEKKGKELVSRQWEVASNRIDSIKDSFQSRAAAPLRKIETVIDKRVASVVGLMGIASKKDMSRLSSNLEELNTTLKSLQTR